MNADHDAIRRMHLLGEAIGPHAGIAHGWAEYVWSILNAVGCAMVHLEEPIEHDRLCQYVDNPDPLIKRYANKLIHSALDDGLIQLPEDWPLIMRKLLCNPMPGHKHDPWMWKRDAEACWLVLLVTGELRDVFPDATRNLVARTSGASLFGHYMLGRGWSNLPANRSPEFVAESALEWVNCTNAHQRGAQAA